MACTSVRRGWVFSLLLLCVCGCTGRDHASDAAQPPASQPATPAVKPTPPTPLAEKKEELGAPVAWQSAWDADIERDVPADLLSAQAARAVRPVCPAFAQARDTDKRAFWAYTLQALAAAEAGLKPTADVHHTERAVARIDKVTHRPIHQEGLLQLTYEDAQRYGCNFDAAADARLPERSPERTILNPEKNIACGLKILDNQIATQGKPLLSRTSYWSTLRPGTPSYRVFAKQMANVPAACGVRDVESQAEKRHATKRRRR